MKIALIEIEVLREREGISEVRSVGTWDGYEQEFYVPSDLVVDGRYLTVIDTGDGEFALGTETYTHEGTLYDLH